MFIEYKLRRRKEAEAFKYTERFDSWQAFKSFKTLEFVKGNIVSDAFEMIKKHEPGTIEDQLNENTKELQEALRDAWSGYVNLSQDMEVGPMKTQMVGHAIRIRAVLDSPGIDQTSSMDYGGGPFNSFGKEGPEPEKSTVDWLINTLEKCDKMSQIRLCYNGDTEVSIEDVFERPVESGPFEYTTVVILTPSKPS